MKQEIRAEKFILRLWWICVILRIRSWSKIFKSTKEESCSDERHCKRRLRIVRSICWTRIISITNDSRKNHGHYIKATRMRRTSSRRSIRLHPCQNGRPINVIKNSKVRMSRYLDTSTKAQLVKIIVHGRSGRSSRKESVRSSFGRINIEKAIWESSMGTRLGKSSKPGTFIFQPSKRTIIVRVCGRYPTGRQDRKHRNDLAHSHGRSWSGRTNIISWPCILGLHSKRTSNHEWHCCKLQRYVLIQDFVLEPWKNYRPELQGNLTQKQYLLGLVTWKVTQRNVWKDIANLQIKRPNNFTMSQRHAWMTINLKKKQMSQ